MFNCYVWPLFRLVRTRFLSRGVQNQFLDAITSKPFKFFVAGGFWIYLFFILSGYLIAKKALSIAKIKQVISAIVLRFLRFAVPILGTAVTVFILQEVIGFYGDEIQRFIPNEWVMSQYPNQLGIKDVLWEPIAVIIQGAGKFNGPYWVIKDMFLSAIIIYIVGFVRNAVRNKYNFMVDVFVFLMLLYTGKNIILACFVGYMMYTYEDGMSSVLDLIIKKSNWLCWFAIPVPAIVYIFHETARWNILAFAGFFLAISRLPICQRLLERRIALFFGKISFGIYSLHYSVFFTIGLKLMVTAFELNIHHLDFIYIGICFLCFCITVVFSVFFNKFIENLGDKICSIIKKLLYKKEIVK